MKEVHIDALLLQCYLLYRWRSQILARYRGQWRSMPEDDDEVARGRQVPIHLGLCTDSSPMSCAFCFSFSALDLDLSRFSQAIHDGSRNVTFSIADAFHKDGIDVLPIHVTQCRKDSTSNVCCL